MTKDCSFTLTFVFLSIFLITLVAGDSPRNCPNFCKCDLYKYLNKQRNRADCSTKNLIDPNLDISQTVEILHLDYNDINTLDDTCFQNYKFLINLTISYNAIHTIYLNSFTNLRRINAIDLSYNRLQELDERLFESNHKLQTLNLEGNKFMTLANKPFLRSASLRTLNLRNSQISYISAKIFSAMPELQQIDLSQNVLISMELDVFSVPQKLQRLELSENPWHCDEALKQAVTALENRDIHVELLECKSDLDFLPDDIREKMFERMKIVDSAEEHLNVSIEVVGEDSFDNSWHELEYEDDDTEPELSRKLLPSLMPSAELCDGTPMEVCTKYRRCLEKISHQLFEETHKKEFEERNFSQSDLNLVFFVGIGIGMATVLIVLSCALCMKAFFEGHTKNGVSLSSSFEHVHTLSPEEPSTSALVSVVHSPPPVPPLRRPKRSRSSRSAMPQRRQMPPTHAVVRDERAPDNFFTRLFGRPARHQYYRTLNQNTATVIRRLSRSNLFNNRLSQHFLDRERGRTDSSAPTTPITPTFSATAPLRPERPETPPPNYGDIVVNCDRN